MNNDLAGETAVWRALFGGAQSPLLLLICVFVILIFKLIFKEPPKCFAADDGSGSEDGRSSRCCTLGELLQECDLVSVMAVQEKCDGKRTGAEFGFLASSLRPASSLNISIPCGVPLFPAFAPPPGFGRPSATLKPLLPL